MTDFARQTVESPCVRNCCLDDKDMCLGCFRMMDEILLWGQATDQQKRAILVKCHQREKAQSPLKPYT